MDYQRMFVESRDVLDGVVRDVARGHGLTGETLAELRRSVDDKVKADDFGLLRRYAGRSHLRTYFLVIAERVFLEMQRVTGVAAQSPGLPAPSSRMSAPPPFPA